MKNYPLSCSPEIAKMLLEAYPAATEVKDSNNKNPLHCALEQDASVEIVKMMLDAYPAAAEVEFLC